METKRFIGSDLRRLFARVRSEFGPDAIVVRTRTLARDGADPLIELVAAPPHAEHELSLEFQWRLIEGSLRRLELPDPHATVGDLEDMLARGEVAPAAPPEPAPAAAVGDWFEGFVSRDVPALPGARVQQPASPQPAPRPVRFARLDGTNGEVPPPTDWPPRPRIEVPVFQRVSRTAASRSLSLPQRLVEAGLSPEAADIVVRRAGRETDPVQALAIALDTHEPRYPDEAETAVITIEGPPGSGRTTALLQMALDCATAGREAILVAADASASDVLHAGAERLGLPIVDIAEPSDVRGRAAKANRGACLFVDTPSGRFKLRRTRAAHYSYLALPADRAPDALERELAPFAGGRFAGCVITRAGRATNLSHALSTVIRLGLGVAFLSSGPDITSGAQLPDPLGLASGIFHRTSGVTTNGRLVASA